MKYIKVTNDGILDVVGACSMLGASVKMREDSIGMFGTGLKYALAQAARLGTKIFIASGNDVFETTTTQREFRDRAFTKVNLRDTVTGEIHETPITTDFGQHDWENPWNVYREIVCNAMDEDGKNVTLVNVVRRTKNKTTFYLDYETFGEFFDNPKKYFTKKRHNWIKPGTGIIYKHGVRVGQLENFNLDMQLNNVQITESRDVDRYSARYGIANAMENCKDRKTWTAFFESTDANRVCLNLSSRRDVISAFKSSLKKFLGGKFAISVDAENVKNDLLHKGIIPFVVPSNWDIPESKFPSYQDIFKLDRKAVRVPTYEEKKMIKDGLKCCEMFGMECHARIRVFEDQSAADGMAEKKGHNIWLHANIFNNRERFLQVFLEEVGHHHSGYGDYTREFTNYFRNRLVTFYLENE
jgi:hypothetical protein